MKRMGKYCKAFHSSRFRDFPGWSEKVHSAVLNSEPADVTRADKAHLYLQEDYTVTDGVFLGEKVVYDDVTREWISFCTEVLQFRPLQRAERVAPPTESH